MDQDMAPAERRRLRTDALEYALRAKSEHDDCGAVIAAARVYGDFIAGQDGPRPIPPDQHNGADCVAKVQQDSGLSYEQASRQAGLLLQAASQTGIWLDLPERLIEMRRLMKAQS